MKKFVVLIIIFAFSFMFSLKAESIEIPDKIKVVLADNAKEINLSVRGEYKITTLETGELLKTGATFFNIKIKPNDNGIQFGGDYFKIHAIQIIPSAEPAVYLGKRLYSGVLQIVRTKDGLLSAINVIDLEHYLKGVLYHEVSHRWPMEAIKAQAIVSRTFALYQAMQNRESFYYLKDDVSSQVYGGVYAHRYRTDKAIADTKGKVLVYKGEILPAFFHATCGGKTEDAAVLWKVNIPPLKGRACPFCKNSPHFWWRYDMPISDIKNRLKEAGYEIFDIYSIEINKRDDSGRVARLILKGRSGTVRISAKDFRFLLGPGLIRSTNFTVYIKEQRAYFEGKGWGHGVGMCQWGAFAMAKKGMTAEQILKYYYPGAQIVILDTTGR